MKISRNNTIKESLSPPSRIKRKNKGFSLDLQFSNQKEKKQHLEALLGKIGKKGKHIIATNSIRTVEEYKRMIQEYLSLIIQNGYHIKKIQSPWNGQQMTIVEVLDKELEELSQLVLKEERDTLSIISKVDCISGILLDAYK